MADVSAVFSDDGMVDAIIDELLNEDNGKSTMSEYEDKAVFPITELPDELLINVLSWLSGTDLVQNCVLVNKHWYEVINQQKLWHDKCVRVGYYKPGFMPFKPHDFKTYYFKNPYTRNLIKNPCAKEGLKHWKVVENGGNGIRCETTPSGSHPVGNYNTDITGDVGCWATSYEWAIKHQTIDLIEEGCDPEVLDKLKPDIVISEWYAARFDCGIHYELKVCLLDKDNKELDKFKFEDTKNAGRDWFSVEHTFRDNPVGIRFILFQHKGKDTQWWRGHYGAKITLSSVRFKFQNS